MNPAEFEEREYETPLYNQLANGTNKVWSPGQVFEGHIGIDYAMFFEEEWLFRLHSFNRIPLGAVLSRYRWPRAWFRRRPTNRLPTFRLNLFIQTKRPDWSKKPTRILREKGFRGLYWRFNLNEDQQEVLEKVAEKLDNRALVIYAAPTFHQHHDLYRNTINGTIIENSTFPSIAKLKAHEAWYYHTPGASGVANPIPEEIIEPTLKERIEKLIESKEGSGSWSDSLKSLASEIVNALSDEKLKETSRRASFFDAIKQIDKEFDGFENAGALHAFFTVQAFCEAFSLDWYVIGPS